MDNLLESNERTLVIFDAVCSGLAECLELVHADIKQMTEHRNHLLTQQHIELERQQQQQQQQQVGYTETDLNQNQQVGANSPQSSPDDSQDKTLVAQTTDLDSTATPESPPPQDLHHLDQLKLLDKRLAESFSQALSMYGAGGDQHKSSQAKTRDQRALASSKTSQRDHHRARPGILQMLWGRAGGNKLSRQQHKRDELDEFEGNRAKVAGERPPDTRLIIDDINRQTRLAMQYSKQLEANLLRVEDLRAKYEMHLKMSLVVRSVSRAYLLNPYTGEPEAPSPLPASPYAPGSLGRPQHQQSRAHHLSSLMVNDSSSLGATTTTTRSSLSSLNLSSWSFSRHNQQQQQQEHPSDRTKLSRKRSQQSHQQPPVGMHNELLMLEDQHRQQQQYQQQQYVSTISLDSLSRQQQQARRGLSKMISPTSSRHSSSNSSGSHKQHSPTSSQSTTQPDVPTYQLDHHLVPYQQQQQQFTCAGGDECDCALMDSPDEHDHHRHHHHTPQSSFRTPVGGPAHSRPLSQYIYGATSELATPTTTGTLAGQPKEFNYATATGAHAGAGAGFAGPGGLLHKSASHSSLKKLKGNSSSHRLSGLYSNATHMGTTGSKTTIKEFIDNIERIETEFEAYMGSFLLKIEDIQGFARVCQGDVFEIVIRYGTAQKFKTKISVLKDNSQKCDHKQTVFKARIADVIAIKAYECKGLGKKILLGHKLCETRDLFMARSQLMIISLNQTGSIKLNLVITWNPLHMTPNSSLDLVSVARPRLAHCIE